MIVYELTHIFYSNGREVIYDVKNLGLYASYVSAQDAILYYKNQPGFAENPEAFVLRRKAVAGRVEDFMVYEALVYFHTEDFELEHSVDLGLFGSKHKAEETLVSFRNENSIFLMREQIYIEYIVNQYVIDRKEWAEGFVVVTEPMM